MPRSGTVNFSAHEPAGRHSRESGNPYTRDPEEKPRHSPFAFLMVLWDMDSGSSLRYGRNDAAPSFPRDTFDYCMQQGYSSLFQGASKP